MTSGVPGFVWSVRVGWSYLVVVGGALELEMCALDLEIDFAEGVGFQGDPADMWCDF